MILEPNSDEYRRECKEYGLDRKVFEFYSGVLYDCFDSCLSPQENRIPMPLIGIMERQINSGLESWEITGFDSFDFVGYRCDEVKLIKGLDVLKLFKEQKLNRTGRVSEENYDTLKGLNLDREKTIFNNQLRNIDEILNHSFWKWASFDDTSFLKNYVEKRVEQFRRFNQDNLNTMMGVYASKENESPILRAWCVVGLGGYGRSGANDWSWLDGGDGCSVGLAPEALKLPSYAELNRVMKPYVDAYYNLFPDRVGNDVVNRVNNGVIVGDKTTPVTLRGKDGMSAEVEISDLAEERTISQSELSNALMFAENSGQKDRSKILQIIRAQIGLSSKE